MKADNKDLIVASRSPRPRSWSAVAEVCPWPLSADRLGQADSEGLRKAWWSTSRRPCNSIRKAVEEAELMAACHITDVYTGIAAVISQLQLERHGCDQESRGLGEDVARVIETRVR